MRNFPRQFSVDELGEMLIVIEKVEIGNRQTEKAEIISDIELDKEIEKWFR
ncbi:MAG: hypothetical protein RBR87_05455 [Bacteroidales bacterium]|nr:hypothetical protein [Bacteroidales bacterium]